MLGEHLCQPNRLASKMQVVSETVDQTFNQPMQVGKHCVLQYDPSHRILKTFHIGLMLLFCGSMAYKLQAQLWQYLSKQHDCCGCSLHATLQAQRRHSCENTTARIHCCAAVWHKVAGTGPVTINGTANFVQYLSQRRLHL